MPNRVSRRTLLAASATLALPRALMAQGAVFDTDVVVIGAGAAGLAAARQLQQLGQRFVVIEARNRIGGRVFTDASLGARYDAGAFYIHWAERNPWREEALRLGVEAIDENTLPRGAYRFFENGVPAERGGNRRAYWNGLADLFDTETGPVPDVSFVERVSDQPEMQRGVFGMARMSLGEEAERVSALDYARLWSGDDLILPQGYGALVERFGAGLPVRLATPVRRISWGGQGVRVETDAGALSARAAIVTVSAGVLAADSIRFDPALPALTQSGIAGIGMGALTKVGLSFGRERFGLPPNSNLWDARGPRAGFNFECFPFDRDIVIAYFGGDHAREVVRLGEAGALALLLDSFAAMVGEDARKAFVGGRMHGWCDDPFAMGCYSHARPGHADARARLAQPVAGKLYFAGEATAAGPDGSFGAAMTAGGAYLAGQAAARLAAQS